MARFEMELPNDLIKSFGRLNNETQKIIGEMTQEGAKVVLENIKANVPPAFHDSDIMRCLHLSKVYDTPSDDGINTKVAFWGYFKPKDGTWPKWQAERGTDKMAAELVCNIFEYGRTSSPYPKHPFVRKSFKRKQIQTAMMKKQDEYLEKFDREFKIT